ncbi:MAG: glycerophosphodiester phosphodiesterase family protein [Alkalilacustris sp.]
MRPTVFDHPLPLAIAHRGGALEADENTEAAFTHAAGLGYRFIETDVQATRDGIAVIHHDDTLERSCAEPDRIADLTWAELARRRTRAGNPIPRLDAMLGAFPDMRFILEAKSDAAPAAMAQAIAATGALPRVAVGAFSARRTRALRASLGPGLAWSPAHLGVARVWLAGWGLPLRPPPCTALQVPERFHGIPVVTDRLLRAAHAHGLQVHVWTVNDPAGMVRLLDLGVDGIMTDRPGLLRDVLTARSQWTGDR